VAASNGRLLNSGGRRVRLLGRARVRQLRRRVDAAVAPRRHRPLPVQRVRPVPQDERHEPAAGQAAAAQRKSVALVLCAPLYTSIKTAAVSRVDGVSNSLSTGDYS